MGETSTKSDTPKLTKKQVKAYLADIEKKVIDREGSDMASLVAINELLNLPNSEQLLDESLKTQLKDLWIKLKSNGVQVDDPPLLFGLPDGFGEEEKEDEEEELRVPLETAAELEVPESDEADGEADVGEVEEPDETLPH